MIMAKLPLLILSITSIWMTSEGQRDFSILSKVIPRDTFVISNPAVRPGNGYISPYPSLMFRRGPGVIQRQPGSLQDAALRRPLLPHRSHPTQQNPLRRQHYRPSQLRPTVSRFSLNQQRPQQPVAPLRSIAPQPQEANPQNPAVKDTFFITGTSDVDGPSTHSSESNRNRPRRPVAAVAAVGTIGAAAAAASAAGATAGAGVGAAAASAVAQVSPATNFLPGQAPTRHPLCVVTPPTGDCRAAFPRYFYNPQTDQCDCFLYGGCGPEGLAYSYSTLEECVSTCAPGNPEEGPVCNELFFDGDVFLDPPAETPSTDHISDDELLNMFGNFVPQQDPLPRESTRLRQSNHVG